jgi:hypothetical protein
VDAMNETYVDSPVYRHGNKQGKGWMDEHIWTSEAHRVLDKWLPKKAELETYGFVPYMIWYSVCHDRIWGF